MVSVLPERGASDVLYLVDLSGYVFRAYHAIPATLTSPAGEPTHAVLGTVTMLQRLLRDRNPARVAVAMDSKGPTFRQDLDPRYKAHRPPPPEDLSQQMTRCRQIVEAYRLPVLQEDGLEADDLIASAIAAIRQAKLRAVVVSADKDLMQLVGPDVQLWDTMRNKVYGEAEVEEKFGVLPTKLRDLLALTGDTSDNIPGVPSVGPKTAADLLTTYGTLDGIFAHLDQIPRKKLREMLAAHEAEARLSQTLVTLRDDLRADAHPEAMVAGAPDIPELRRLFTELGFTRLLGDLDRTAPVETTTNAASAATNAGAPRHYRALRTREDLAAFVREAQRAEHLAIDTETDSLDAVRAALVGLSLAFAEGEGVYVPLGHRSEDADPQLSLDVVRAELAPLLAGPRPAMVGHHLKFDELVLRRHGLPLGTVIFDTMIASYLLDPEASHGLKELARKELGATMTTYDEVTQKQRGKQLSFAEVRVDVATPYAAADALLSWELTQKLAPQVEEERLGPLLRDVELPLARTLADMELAGVQVDAHVLAAMGEQMLAQIASLERKAKELAGRDFNVNAPRQLEIIFFDELKLPVVKRTKTARSTDAEVLEALATAHPLPAVILEQRQLAKLKSTYVDALPALINPNTGRLHTRYNQTVAATGRLSSSDPNLQNIPVRTELGRGIRAAFVAPPGHVLVSADYSQIELRILAHFSGDPVLVEAFQEGQDIHTRTAMEIFSVAAGDVSGDQRRVAKTINFGVIYGMGDSALGKRLGIPREKAASFIETYFVRYAGVRRYFDELLDEARAAGSVRTLLGRRRFLPDLGSANRGVRLQAERMAQNTPIQGTAADILKLAMVRLREPVVSGARMLLTVHDELIFEVPVNAVTEAEANIRRAMETIVDLRVPLVVDVGHGANWAQAKG